MSKNNPVGNIPIETPILKRITIEAVKVYLGLSDEEVIALNKEIKAVSDTNCTADIKYIADMLANKVDSYCRNYIDAYSEKE